MPDACVTMELFVHLASFARVEVLNPNPHSKQRKHWCSRKEASFSVSNKSPFAHTTKTISICIIGNISFA